LNTLEAETADARQEFNGQRLGEAGNAFDNGVAATDENEKKLIDDFALADDDFGELRADVRSECGKVLHG
jgi:hypothetical protein